MNLPLNRILNGVCCYFQLTEEELVSEIKTKELSYPRHIYFYLCSEFSEKIFREIGELVNRDHSTVVYGVNRIRVEKELYFKVKKDIESIYPFIFMPRLVVDHVDLPKSIIC